MALRDDVMRKIARKQQEIAALEQQVNIARAYVQAMEDTLKMVTRDESGQETGKSLRKGSGPAKAQKALRAAGKPLHIKALLEAMGKTVTRNSRSGLSSSLAAYSRRGDVFTRPAPNTFGLVEFGATEESQEDAETPEGG